MNSYSLLAGAAVLLTVGAAEAQSSLTPAQAKAILEPFYAIFTMPVVGDVKSLLEKSTRSDWQSCSSETVCYSREQREPVFRNFGQAVPDLKYVMKELSVSGDTVFVRGELSGTPAGTFLGVPHSGRSFSIMTIDQNVIKDGKLLRTYHVEDWASAIRQLSEK
jgi:predicted ester cyclase